MIFWCNGEWRADLPASFMDRGHLHGLALFETLLAVNGKPCAAERHLIRLAKGCEQLGWSISQADLPEIMRELLARNGFSQGRARIRLTLTAGCGSLDDLSPGHDHLLWMAAFPSPEPPVSISARHCPWPRNEHSPLAGLKCASYAENLIALNLARSQGYEETIFSNTAGNLCEAATANLFLVKDGQLYTPSLDSGCLPGIARQILIDHFPCQETVLTLEDLHAADEVFLTSSTRGPVPVTRFDKNLFTIGPITQSLQKIWNSQLGAR